MPQRWQKILILPLFFFLIFSTQAAKMCNVPNMIYIVHGDDEDGMPTESMQVVDQEYITQQKSRKLFSLASKIQLLSSKMVHVFALHFSLRLFFIVLKLLF